MVVCRTILLLRAGTLSCFMMSSSCGRWNLNWIDSTRLICRCVVVPTCKVTRHKVSVCHLHRQCSLVHCHSMLSTRLASSSSSFPHFFCCRQLGLALCRPQLCSLWLLRHQMPAVVTVWTQILLKSSRSPTMLRQWPGC